MMREKLRRMSDTVTGSKRGLLPLLMLALLCGVACGGGTEGPSTSAKRWILTNVHVEGYPTAQGLRSFEEQVRGDAGLAPHIALDLQLGGVLGNEKESLEKLGFGAVQMACTSVAPLAEFSPTIGVLTLPYLFRDAEHMWQVLDGPLGDELLASLEPSGFVGLAWYDAGARSFYNRERPIRRLDDLAGLKIRVQKSEIMRRMVEALGASPVSLGFKEVYTNLYTGSIDGAENNLPSYRSERHFEVAGFYSFDRHSMIPDVLLVQSQAFDALNDEQQAALRRAAVASSRAQRQFWQQYETEARRAVEAAGSEIFEVDDVSEFQRAVQPLYDELGGNYGDWIERIRAVR